MSNQELNLPFHRKYRPSKLSEYIGNEKIKKTALSYLSGRMRPQVVLLEGSSGCGKTSFARLLAKEYLCEDRDSVNGACCQCSSCLELEEYIATGESENLLYVREVDIADQSGKADINAILEEASLPVMGGGWKVYIFDECHMATKAAQNRMLKIAEEPPENVLLIFCTTDPDKMLETLLNRCQLALKVNKPSTKDLAGLLKRICVKEQVEYDMKGLFTVAGRAECTIRKSLVLLEQIVNERGSVCYSDVLEVFDEVSASVMFDFYRRLLRHDVYGYITLVHDVKTKMDLKQFVNLLLDFTKRGIYILNSIPVEGLSDGELKAYKTLFSEFTVGQIAMLMDKLLDLKSSDTETKLLLLGYTGLTEKRESSNKSDSVEIEYSDSEISAESNANLKNTEAKNSVSEEVAKLAIESETGVVGMDALAEMFGGTIVSE